jgi:hypothetical protein
VNVAGQPSRHGNDGEFVKEGSGQKPPDQTMSDEDQLSFFVGIEPVADKP